MLILVTTHCYVPMEFIKMYVCLRARARLCMCPYVYVEIVADITLESPDYRHLFTFSTYCHLIFDLQLFIKVSANKHYIFKMSSSQKCIFGFTTSYVTYLSIKVLCTDK